MTNPSWISLYPEWYVEERRRLARHYPQFRADGAQLRGGGLLLYGELLVRPPGGAHRHPVALIYPRATPYEKPIVAPLEALPEVDEEGAAKGPLAIRMHDHRHQMPDGALCLFQRETRANPTGDVVSGTDALRRASRWFLGIHTGHWPPDSAESELEAHFERVTDVLLSAELFSGRLDGGHGRFFFAGDYRRLIDVPTDAPPMIVTSVTVESAGVVQVVDARGDLQHVYPWIRNEAWGTITAVESEARAATGFDPVGQGCWWSLPAEPRPFNDGGGLLRELQCAVPDRDAWEVMSASLGARMATARQHCIAFRYPGRGGEAEWLMVSVAPGDRRAAGGALLETEPEKRRRFEAARVGGIRAHSIRPSALRLRNTGVVDSGVSGKTAALVGLGALGSEVAELLAKAGVGTLRLCDPDRLAIGNVARHVGGVTDFGAAKARVVASRLLQINPHLTFIDEDLQPWSATDSPDRLAALIDSADLVVATTADEGAESLVNHLAVIRRKPVLYGRALRRASMGRVFLVRPGHDACKACLAGYATAGREGQAVAADWIDVRESEDEVLLHECGRPVIAGSAVDLAFVAGLTARVALTVLEGRDELTNHWLWTTRPAPDVDRRLNEPLSTFACRLESRPECPVCAEPEIVQLVLTEDARSKIVTATESSLAAESCGVLIGHVDDQRRAVALRATGPGPAAGRSASICRRDVSHVQAELDRAAAELGARGQYIGEWHSHLVPAPEPSPTDVESLLGIAQAPNYLIRCPVMVIAGLDPAKGRCEHLLAWAFPIGRGMHPLPIQTAGATDATASP